jgi:hypothetical protein
MLILLPAETSQGDVHAELLLQVRNRRQQHGSKVSQFFRGRGGHYGPIILDCDEIGQLTVMGVFECEGDLNASLWSSTCLLCMQKYLFEIKS